MQCYTGQDGAIPGNAVQNRIIPGQTGLYGTWDQTAQKLRFALFITMHAPLDHHQPPSHVFFSISDLHNVITAQFSCSQLHVVGYADLVIPADYTDQ